MEILIIGIEREMREKKKKPKNWYKMIVEIELNY